MSRRDEVIRMAREAFDGHDEAKDLIADAPEAFERFAAMVAADEREQCAKEAEAIRDDYVATGSNKQACAADYIAEKIRALNDEASE